MTNPSPTPPKVQAPPPPEKWMVAAAHNIIKKIYPQIAAMRDNPEWHPNMYQSRFDDTIAVLQRHAPSPAPASEGRSEEKESVNDMTDSGSYPSLEYIAASPLTRYGGFHPTTVQIAKDAIAERAKLLAACTEYRAKLDAAERELADATARYKAAEQNHTWAQQTVETLRKQLASHYPGAGVDSARLDWLAEMLADVQVAGADPLEYIEDDDDWRKAWRLAIDAAMAQSAGRDDGRGGAT